VPGPATRAAQACVRANACGSSSSSRIAQACPKRPGTSTRRRGAGETRRISAFPPCIMPLDVSRPDLSLAVVGTGVMGRGIAQIAAQAGIHALLHDSRPGAAREAKESVSAQLARLAEKGRLEREALARAQANLVIADSREALAPCPIVIEAIVEDLEAKLELFRSLEDMVSGDCLMASNTSSFSITAIAAACRRPERIAGFHFFNPVPLMKVVEVVDGLLTAPWVGEPLAALARRCRHEPVRAKDTPGFIVNHAGRGYGTEALRLPGV